jgi:uncharacterized membrane protein YbhN (UPF0104 family)
VLRIALAAVASTAAVALLLPRVSGAPWSAIAGALQAATPGQLAALALVWAAGLLVHSRVLTAALPGLTVRRALTLNLTGSAVANVVPLGGGLGIGLNYLMVRRWGFTRSQFSLFTGLVNAWHVALKALLPAAALALLVADGVLLQRRVLAAAVVAGAVLLALLALVAAAVLAPRAGQVVGRAADRVLRLKGSARTVPMADRLATVRASCRDLLTTAWRPMTWGVLGYSALQMFLLWACLAVVGAPVPAVAVVAVFAVERAMTALPFTPGGSGVAEVAATAALVALGTAPAAAAAGVLLYRAFVFGLEIPVGGTWLVGWWLVHRTAGQVAVA